MNVLDLFSGIGGFSLGLERAGMRTVAFCECEPYPRAVLAKHWPSVPCHDDVRTLTASRLAADGITVDVICGGFPCQDISVAGKGAGLAGARSGLWREFFRLISELRPRFVIVENVSALLGRGLDQVLGDLASIGYDAEWHCIPASYVGAPHRRDRIWIVAYPCSTGGRADAAGYGLQAESTELQPQDRKACPDDDSQVCRDVADAISNGLQGKRDGWGIEQAARHETRSSPARTSDADAAHTDYDAAPRQREHGGEVHGGSEAIRPDSGRGFDWWAAEPDVGRVADGIPSRLDRLKSLGNAVVPQIPEIIGRAIMSLETAK